MKPSALVKRRFGGNRPHRRLLGKAHARANIYPTRAPLKCTVFAHLSHSTDRGTIPADLSDIDLDFGPGPDYMCMMSFQ